MISRIKQFFCSHSDICTITEVSAASLFIVKSLIRCSKCEKSFSSYPNAKCCYVEHIHANMMQQHFMKDFLNVTQQGK